jgi:hypothetical protein
VWVATDPYFLFIQILSRLKPYHTIKSDSFLLDAIVGGLVPSVKPERPYAPSCLNEHLWNIVRSCWNQPIYRPASSWLLGELNRLLEARLVDLSPPNPDRMSIDFDGNLPKWPPKIVDFDFGDCAREVLKSTSRADIWT